MKKDQSFLNIITIISGEKNTGKTRLCARLIASLKENGKNVTGIISPGLYQGGKKVGIMAEDVRSGQARQIATYRAPGWDPKRPQREWVFNSENLEWANRMFEKAAPTDYLFIDEIGFLELEENAGWIAGLKIITEGQFNRAFIVVRPDLLDIAGKRWGNHEVIMVKAGDDLEEIKRRILNHLSESE